MDAGLTIQMMAAGELTITLCSGGVTLLSTMGADGCSIFEDFLDSVLLVSCYAWSSCVLPRIATACHPRLGIRNLVASPYLQVS
jgi:hypothetical protein